MVYNFEAGRDEHDPMKVHSYRNWLESPEAKVESFLNEIDDERVLRGNLVTRRWDKYVPALFESHSDIFGEEGIEGHVPYMLELEVVRHIERREPDNI